MERLFVVLAVVQMLLGVAVIGFIGWVIVQLLYHFGVL